MKKRKGISIYNKHLIQDILAVFFSIFVAIILVRLNFFHNFLVSARELEAASFLAGMFFTSVFTTAPAIIAFSEIAKTQPLFLTAFLGSVGAVIVDYAVFLFMRDRVANDVIASLNHTRKKHGLHFLINLKSYRWLTFLLAGFIIASPLPDELAISLLGFSRLTTKSFIFLSFTFNFIGILLIGYIGRTFF